MQKDIVDQAQLHMFKDNQRNKDLEDMFKRYSELNLSGESRENVERLRRKVTHDIDHQINDLV